MTDSHTIDELHRLPVLITDEGSGLTHWSQNRWPTEPRGGMILSPRIDCSSLRLRLSLPGYTSDWHVASDPTLIIIRAGQLRIFLRNAEERTFVPGDGFIAADHVPAGQSFDPSIHGHRAEVVGNESLQAVHIKLGQRLS